ncbi:MAG: class I SAM-dependent methyltransferase [Bacteroidaceae bacterium]|nr:class I SAM-dependent methyltransferase [Bacteroidaceae bacterium]MBR5707504.1 class I SAM-dependent methyltransferase [Bacteroidaceae bacterium]
MATSGQGIGYTGEDLLEEYISAHIGKESTLLRDIYRETNLRLLNPRMASGHIQGRLLKMLVTMIRPKLILEVGTFTGYATLCMAEGLPDGGVIHTVEIDDELEDFIKKGFDKSPYSDRIRLHIGDAIKVVPQLDLRFDMIFLDGEKREYPDYYAAFLDYLKPGGYMIADNTLWDGHVVDSNYDTDPQTIAVRKFNDIVMADERVEVAMIPIRDGLSIIRKK